MEIRYKLTNQDYTTHNDMIWEIGKTNKATGEGFVLCTNGVLHCYKSPVWAVIANSFITNKNKFDNPRMFKVECKGKIVSNGIKDGCKIMTPIEEIEVPKITDTQQKAFFILMALKVYDDSDYIKWANEWLSGEDRSVLLPLPFFPIRTVTGTGSSDKSIQTALFKNDKRIDLFEIGEQVINNF